MESILEVILQCLFEFFVQIVGELFVELGMHPFAEVFKKRPVESPFVAGIGYFLLGAAVGGLSLLVAGTTFIHDSTWRVLNLFVTPIFAGLMMMAVGAIRSRKGQELVRLDRFGYGLVFAFGMALVRFIFAARPA